MDAGMDEFLTKPLVPHQLVRCLRSQIERARGCALTIRSRERSLPVGDARWPQIDGIDGQEVAARLRGDLGLFKRMVRRLLLEFADLADTAPVLAQDGLGGDDARAHLAARAHKLAGSAGVVGATAVAQLAARLEAALRDGAFAHVSPNEAGLAALAHAMRALVVAAQPLMSDDNVSDEPGDALSGPSGPLHQPSREFLLELARQLQRQQMEAAARCRAMAPALQKILSPDRFRDLMTAMEEFDFASAAQAVRDAAERIDPAAV
jgi:HPt (histidine-containing phosphotransfer) domain-containing protein